MKVKRLRNTGLDIAVIIISISEDADDEDGFWVRYNEELFRT